VEVDPPTELVDHLARHRLWRVFLDDCADDELVYQAHGDAVFARSEAGLEEFFEPALRGR
jgi:hypothetical protein